MFFPVILAGGRGTRFWPLSRKRRAKQLLALDGKQTMIQQTVARLLELSAPKSFWIITNADLQREIIRQLPRLNKKQILAEPAGRNTAPAIGLAAFILMRANPDAVKSFRSARRSIADQIRPWDSTRPLRAALPLRHPRNRLHEQGDRNIYLVDLFPPIPPVKPLAASFRAFSNDELSPVEPHANARRKRGRRRISPVRTGCCPGRGRRPRRPRSPEFRRFRRCGGKEFVKPPYRDFGGLGRG